jgi:hypothetical protein
VFRQSSTYGMVTPNRAEARVSTPLGKKIRELRQAKGYTLEKLADLAQSSKSYIWELENKEPPRPSAEKVARHGRLPHEQDQSGARQGCARSGILP